MSRWNKDSNDVHFDRATFTDSNHKICLLSSKGLKSGTYEWKIQILRTDVDLHEIGVVSTPDIDDLAIGDMGVSGTNEMGARSVYGCEIGTDSTFYGSWFVL